MASEVPDFPAYCGEGEPRFANDVELECAKLLDYYRVPWDYEPTTFVLDSSGRVAWKLQRELSRDELTTALDDVLGQ